MSIISIYKTGTFSLILAEKKNKVGRFLYERFCDFDHSKNVLRIFLLDSVQKEISFTSYRECLKYLLSL